MKSATFLIAVALLSGAAYPADTRAAQPGERPYYYYWLHPKLGMVKVDRQTNAMLTGARASSQHRVDGGRAAPAGR